LATMIISWPISWTNSWIISWTISWIISWTISCRFTKTAKLFFYETLGRNNEGFSLVKSMKSLEVSVVEVSENLEVHCFPLTKLHWRLTDLPEDDDPVFSP
jgi:hypothetical protein